MAITTSNFTEALKLYYGPQKLMNATFDSKSRPGINFLPKDESFTGRNQPFPIVYEDAFGRSATFSDAQTNASNVAVEAWDIDVVANNEVVVVDTDTLLRSRNDKGAFLKQQFYKIDTALNVLANDVEIGIFGYADGRIGVISAITATTITLTNAADARHFFINQVLVSAANATSAVDGGAATPNTTTVTAVNYDTGVLTVGTDRSGTWSANDLIFSIGDYTDTTALKISGFETWLQGTSTLFGVDRSLHSRLQGIAATGALADIKKAITDAAATATAQAGSEPDLCFVPWDGVFSELVDQLEADVMRPPGRETSAGFSGVTIFGPAGSIKILGATQCTPNTCYLVDSSVIKLVSMGPLVRIVDDDGLMAGRRGSAAGLEIRADSHAQLVIQSPGRCARIALS